MVYINSGKVWTHKFYQNWNLLIVKCTQKAYLLNFNLLSYFAQYRFLCGYGSIGDKPWYRQIVLLFGWVLHFISAFFRTLFSPLMNGIGSQYESSSQRPWGPGGPPRPPRRMGRFTTLSSCQAPMPGGG